MLRNTSIITHKCNKESSNYALIFNPTHHINLALFHRIPDFPLHKKITILYQSLFGGKYS